MPAPWPDSVEESEAKRPRVSAFPARSRECRRSILSAGGLRWSSADVALAASLLETPNARFPSVAFSCLEEKRRVFTLVYDVLRYKSVLNQALNDLYFFTRYPHLKESCHLVWLLVFDLYKRDFALRDPLEPEEEAAFSRQGLHEIDEVLWQLRVKLAATVSRLRIKSGAHSLSNLLPRHLRFTRSALEENIITGWVNIFKTNLRETCGFLESLGITPLPRDHDALEPMTFKTDHLLPRFLHIMPALRQDLVESPLVLDHHIIMQERTFCLGPAVMAQLLKDYALSGKVAQTHISSPITMAYFANLLINNDKIEALLVFGAGYRKAACEQYLLDLGVKNTHVYSESFSGLSAESKVLDNVIAVLATPPNTNSSVVDPVDLAVARGGDLQILQQLTDDDFASTPRGENINKFLVDQRDTLRRAMSKPQIQFVVYETHSRFCCENEEMATALVNDLNNYAAEVHLEELRRAQGETQERERERSQVEASDSQLEVPIVKVEDDLSLPMPSPVQSVVIPPSDLFELADLPELCPNFENCLDLVTEGTYIAVIKRKEITRLDPKYMIQMAEARGLFGRPEGTPKVKSTGQTARAKAALAALQARSEMMSDKSKTKVKVEMDRIAAPTRASLLRDVRPPSARDCPRYTHHLTHDGTPVYRNHLYEERKTFLTPLEEDQLIRRLYTSPRIPFFPPRLYEDLPPLKFWNSPASVIESYLQRKVFQRRLQLAYEFNQSKEAGLHTTEGNENESPELLSQAMMQLTADINYFEYFASKQTLIQAERMEIQAAQNIPESQNKAYWEHLFPEISNIPDIEHRSITEEQSTTEPKNRGKFLDEIKKRYFNYKSFYRLQNVREENRKALTLTISVPESHSGINTIETPVPSVSFYESDDEKHQHINKTEQTRKILLKIESEHPITKKSHNQTLMSTGRLPKIMYSSLDSLKHPKDHNLHYLPKMSYERESLLPYVSPRSTLIENTFSNRGTVVTLRDSLLLTQERLSKASKSVVPKQLKEKISQISLASHRDSYTVMMNKWLEKHKMGETVRASGSETHLEQNNQKNEMSKSLPCFREQQNTLVDHNDSVLLALERLSSSKKKETSEALICDVCNNRNQQIHFTCSFHARMSSPIVLRTPAHSINLFRNKTTSFLSHKDSVELVRRKMSYREEKYSVECQTENGEIHSNTLSTVETKPPQPGVEIKRSQKTKKNYTYRKNEEMNSSTLNKYLSNSLQINQIIVKKDNLPLK